MIMHSDVYQICIAYMDTYLVSRNLQIRREGGIPV